MTFNYRVIKREGILEIHEVYYNDKGEIEFWDESPSWPIGNDIKELLEDLSKYESATELPILDEDEMLNDIKSRIEAEKCQNTAYTQTMDLK